MEPYQRTNRELIEDLLVDVFTVDRNSLSQNFTTRRSGPRDFQTPINRPNPRDYRHLENSQNLGNNRRIRCHFCGERGHIKRTCARKQAFDSRPRQPSGPSHRNSDIELLNLISQVGIRQHTREDLIRLRNVIDFLIQTYPRQNHNHCQ